MSISWSGLPGIVQDLSGQNDCDLDDAQLNFSAFVFTKLHGIVGD